MAEKFKSSLLGCTPNIGLYQRYEECNSWLLDHNYHGEWLALDDEQSYFANTENLYLINPNKGLTKKDAIEILNIFNKVSYGLSMLETPY